MIIIKLRQNMNMTSLAETVNRRNVRIPSLLAVAALLCPTDDGGNPRRDSCNLHSDVQIIIQVEQPQQHIGLNARGVGVTGTRLPIYYPWYTSGEIFLNI